MFVVFFCLNKGGAEIISIDAFNKSENSNEFVIGITIIKVCSISRLFYLLIFLFLFLE